MEDKSKVEKARAASTTCINIWEAVSETIRSIKSATGSSEEEVGLFYDRRNNRKALAETLLAKLQEQQAKDTAEPPTLKPWSWAPPDLAEGGIWHHTRVANLRAAAATLDDPDQAILAGMEMLKKHRRNYTATHPDPKELQILWWEFPAEHWAELREGSSMNFLHEPAAGIHPNSEMDEEQHKVGGNFMDELIALGAMELNPPDEPAHCTTPLFCVPKPGQIDKWRVIANCLTGGQNEAVGSDPVFLPWVNHIASRLYHGGWSRSPMPQRCSTNSQLSQVNANI